MYVCVKANVWNYLSWRGEKIQLQDKKKLEGNLNAKLILYIYAFTTDFAGIYGKTVHGGSNTRSTFCSIQNGAIHTRIE